MVAAAAAAAVVARHLCSDDGDGATTKGPKRVRPRPRPSTAAPLFSPGGCCCGGGGGRGGAARSWRRRPPLAVPCSLPRSVVVLPPLQHELVAAADSLAVVLPALQHELVPAHDSGCWPTPMLIRAAALPCSALLGHCPPRPASLRAARAPRHCSSLRLARSEPRETGTYDARRGLCCVGRAAPSRRTLTAGTTASSVLQAAAGSVGLLAGAPSRRRLPDRARLPACLTAARHCPAWSRPPCCSPISNQRGHRRASQPAP